MGCDIDIAPTQDDFNWAEWAQQQGLEDPLNNGLVTIAFTQCVMDWSIGECVALDHSPLISDSVQFGELVSNSVTRVHSYSSYNTDLDCSVTVDYDFGSVTLAHGETFTDGGVTVSAVNLDGSTDDDLTLWTVTDSALCTGESAGWQISFSDSSAAVTSYTVSTSNVDGASTGKTFSDF